MATKPLGLNNIVIVRAEFLIDPRDNTSYRDWDNATRTTVTKCMIEPFPLAEKLNFEDNRAREFSRSAVRIYAPGDTDVVYTDRLEFDGYEWSVLGHPGKWYDFKAKINHIAVIAQIRQG